MSDSNYDRAKSVPENLDEASLGSLGGSSPETSFETSPNYDDLLLRCEKAELLAKKSEEQVLRFRAEADNVRKRADQDVIKAHKYGLERFLLALLPVLDSLEKGLEAAKLLEASVVLGELRKSGGSGELALQEGMQLTFKLCQEVLKKFNVERIAPEKGQFFDHGMHEAVMAMASNEFPEGSICEVVQCGYRLEDRLLRPARVIVAKSAENESKNNTEMNTEINEGAR